LCTAVSSQARGQDSFPNPPGANIPLLGSFLSSREIWLSGFILIFGLAIVVIEYALLKPVVHDHISEIFKIFTVTLIIIGTLLLITSGFNSQQIAPALGLFGTIAGYILAKVETGQMRREGHDKAKN
jgi:hypothetical protein